jgi:hypothetical protein
VLAQGAPSPTVTNMSASFRAGPYSSLSVYRATRSGFAVGTSDGHLVWSEDGGETTTEAQVIVPAASSTRYPSAAASAPSSRSARRTCSTRRSATEDALQASRSEERTLLSFIYLLGLGLPAGRVQIWMQTSDAIAEMGDIAWPKGDGPMVIAAQPA